MRTRLVALLVLFATLGMLAYQQGLGRVDATVPAGAPRNGALQLGVTSDPLARNWWRPWTAADLSSVRAFERDAGRSATTVMWYADWAHNARPSTAQLNAIARLGGVPEITWEPWDASRGLYVSQPHYRLSNIVAGRFDGYIWTWARTLAQWKRPVLVRLAQEMDGNWFPWSDYANGNRPGQFVLAWQHVHRIFQMAGATNVKWVWSPAFAKAAQTFPGTRSVDVLATTCQNGDRRLFARGWHSFAQTCGPAIARLHALAPKLPIQLAETSTAEAGGSKADWIAGMFSYLAQHPEVRSVIWFNLVKETDWRIESSPAAKRAFAAGLRAVGAE